MTNFEIGPCSPEEYRDGRDSRLHEHELSAESLYTWMIISRIGAAKYPSRVEEIEEETESGLHVVRFTILDMDLNPVTNSAGKFVDGLYKGENNTATLSMFSGRQTATIQEGYFKDHEAHSGGGDQASVGSEVEHAINRILEQAPVGPQERELVHA